MPERVSGILKPNWYYGDLWRISEKTRAHVVGMFSRSDVLRQIGDLPELVRAGMSPDASVQYYKTMQAIGSELGIPADRLRLDSRRRNPLGKAG